MDIMTGRLVMLLLFALLSVSRTQEIISEYQASPASPASPAVPASQASPSSPPSPSSFATNEVVLSYANWTSGRSALPSERAQEHTQVQLKQKVFILTLPRSGSTFASELFRRNPDIVYLFETTRGIAEEFEADKCKSQPEDKRIATIMKSLYDCDFRDMVNYMHSIAWKGHMYSWGRVADLSGREKTTICFPHENDTEKTIAARKAKTVAIKEITMWAPKLNWLQDTLGDELHVIWLIRDVRGWVSSWLVQGEGGTFYSTWGYETKNLWKMYANCDVVTSKLILGEQLLNKIEGILTNTSSAPHLRMAAWWTLDTAVTFYHFQNFAGKSFLLQYEDFSLYPLDVTQQIYSFLGRKVTDEPVLKWLVEATKGGDTNDRYKTKRDSALMTKIWLERLSEQQIREIEDIAGIWFPLFGYERATFEA